MFRLFFKRAESEPIRESYWRKFVYFLHENALYEKRYSWGRVNEDTTQKVVFTDPQLLQVHQELINYGLLSEQAEVHKATDLDGIELQYTIKTLQEAQVFKQRYGGSQFFLAERFERVGQCWRSLAGYFSNQPFGHPPTIRAAHGLQLSMEKAERIASKEQDAKIYSYDLSGKTLRITYEQQGRKQQQQEKAITLNDYQIGTIYHAIQAEHVHLKDSHPFFEGKGNWINPFVSAQLNWSYQDQQGQFQISNSKNKITEQLSFLAFEVLENHLKALGR